MKKILKKHKSANADIVGNDDLIEKITQGNLNFDLLNCNAKYDA